MNGTILREHKPFFFVVRNIAIMEFPTVWAKEAPKYEVPVLMEEEKAEEEWFYSRVTIPFEFWKLPRVIGLDFFSKEAPEILKQGKAFGISPNRPAGAFTRPY